MMAGEKSVVEQFREVSFGKIKSGPELSVDSIKTGIVSLLPQVSWKKIKNSLEVQITREVSLSGILKEMVFDPWQV